MKQSRLLEIIREEISSALGEAATTYAGKSAIDDLKNDKAFSGLTGDAKNDAVEKLTSGGTVTIGEEKAKKLAEKYQLDEETINEMASIKQLKSELERQGKEAELKAVTAAERAALDSLKSDPTITPDGRLKGYVPTLKKELLNTHNIKLQDLLSTVAGKAEDDGVKFSSDIATNTIEKDAANQITGKELGQRGRKADPNKAEKPASAGKKGRPAGEPKTKVATRTKGDDGFDDVSYSDDEEGPSAKDISGDETAKQLGSTPEEKKVKFNQFLSSVKKNKEDKAKIDGILKLAKDKFKFPKTMMDDLKRAAGRDVEI
jgi:hypothetical protein